MYEQMGCRVKLDLVVSCKPAKGIDNYWKMKAVGNNEMYCYFLEGSSLRTKYF